MGAKRYKNIKNIFSLPLSSLSFSYRPSELTNFFMKLVEEPHHGEVMYVDREGNSELIPDEAKVFRKRKEVEEEFKLLAVDGVKFI